MCVVISIKNNFDIVYSDLRVKNFINYPLVKIAFNTSLIEENHNLKKNFWWWGYCYNKPPEVNKNLKDMEGSKAVKK